VAAARSGDRVAFEELVRRHHRPLVNHLYRQVGGRELALDLAQEVFLKIYQSLGSFDPRYRFTTWLYRIASNCAIDHLRRRRPSTCPLPNGDGDGSEAQDCVVPGNEPTPHELLAMRELQGRLEHAIAALPPEFRQLILLRHRLHCRYDEIARITELPLGTVKNRIFRAREMLRGMLGDVLEREAER
jgi:RNA polymerase sigma-70 factor (ECF subfamily)